MGRILTSQQAEELHKSVIAYLSANDKKVTSDTLRTELGLEEHVFTTEVTEKYEKLLEKKWTSTVRLQRKIIDLESRNAALQLELDGAIQAASERNHDLASWLPDSPRYSLQSHTGTVNCVAFHPKFSSLASGSDDCTIKIWDWEFGELEKTIRGHTQAVRGVDYGGPQGHALLASCSSDLTIKLWDPADDYKNMRTLYGHDHSICSIRFAPPSTVQRGLRHLVSASGDHTIKLWNIDNGHCLHTLRGHTDWVRSVCLSTDGRFILSAGNDRTARIWDMSMTSPENILTLTGHGLGINCCALAPVTCHAYLASRGSGLSNEPATSLGLGFIATGSRDNTIKIWDARGTCVRTLVGHKNWVTGVVFHPGGRYLVSVADDKTLRCWDLAQGQCIRVVEGIHEQFITCLQWVPQVAEGISADCNGSSARRRENFKTAYLGDQLRCVVATASMDMTIKVFAH